MVEKGLELNILICYSKNIYCIGAVDCNYGKRSSNMVYRLLEIYQKEGNYRLSKELITKILPSIHKQLQESTDISTKWLLRNSAIYLRIQAIKIYR
jgi:hypothetical protein